MIERSVTERTVPAGNRLVDLKQAIDELVERGQNSHSTFHVATQDGMRRITARWNNQECYTDGCDQEAAWQTEDEAAFCTDHSAP